MSQVNENQRGNAADEATGQQAAAASLLEMRTGGSGSQPWNPPPNAAPAPDMQVLLQMLLAQPGGAQAATATLVQAMQQQQRMPAPAVTPQAPRGGTGQSVQFTTPLATTNTAAAGATFLTPEDTINLMQDGRLGNADQPTQGTGGGTDTADATPPDGELDRTDEQPPAEKSYLAAALRGIALEQAAEGNNLQQDLAQQGKEKPGDYAPFKETCLAACEAMTLFGMTNNQPYVQLFHSMFMYKPPGRLANVDGRYNGDIIAAIGDRDSEGTDPMCCVLAPTKFHWRKVKVPSDITPNSAIHRFYADPANRGKYFDAAMEPTDDVWVPLLPYGPAEVALKAASGTLTPWELYIEVEAFRSGQPDVIQDLLAPLLNWSIAAAVADASDKKESVMAYSISPVMAPPPQLKAMCSSRIDGTLGPRPVAQPPSQPTNPQQQLSVAEISAAAASAMIAAQRAAPPAPQPGHDAAALAVQEGFHSALRVMHETSGIGGSMFKKFTPTTRAYIMGLCGATTWDEVTNFWKTLDLTKNAEDLRSTLYSFMGGDPGTQQDLDKSSTRLYWSDNMMESVRTPRLTYSNQAGYLHTEKGISPLNFMQRTQDEIDLLEAARQHKSEGKANWTASDAKKAETTPRLPPTTWTDVHKLLVTYNKFWELAMGKANEHWVGLRRLREQFMRIEERQSKYDAFFYANIVWQVFDDQVHFLNQRMPMSTFERLERDDVIIWPSSTLAAFANTIVHNSRPDPDMLPAEWVSGISRIMHVRKQALAAAVSGNDWMPRGRGGGGGGGGGNGGGGGGGRSNYRGGNDTQSDETETIPWRKRYPDRYSKQAVNHYVDAAIEEITANFDRFKINHVVQVGGLKITELRECKTVSPGICAAYATGFCWNPACKFAHLRANELPRGYAASLVAKLKPAVAKALKEETDKPPEQRRQSAKRKRDATEDADGTDPK